MYLLPKAFKTVKSYHLNLLFPLSCNIHHPWCHHSPYGACYLPHIWNRIALTSSIIRIYCRHPHSADEDAMVLKVEMPSLSEESHSLNQFALSMKSIMIIIILLIIMLS